MLKANCPSCGAELAFVNKASLSTVCAYCGVTVLRENINLRALGKAAELQDDGTVVQVGAEGEYRQRRFVVIGRVQRSYPKGFWNDWYVTFDQGEGAWLSEAMGFYSILLPAKVTPAAPPVKALTLGMMVQIGGKTFHLKSVLKGECAAVEGELPFVQEDHQPGVFADLAGTEERCATIAYLGATVRVLAGRYVPFDALKLSGLRTPEGW